MEEKSEVAESLRQGQTDMKLTLGESNNQLVNEREPAEVEDIISKETQKIKEN